MTTGAVQVAASMGYGRRRTAFFSASMTTGAVQVAASMGYGRRRTALEDWALLVEAILDHWLFSTRRYRCWLLLRDFLLSPRSDMAARSTFDLLEQYLASSVTSMTSTFNHPQCTPKTKFHAYWAQNNKSTFRLGNTAMTTQKAPFTCLFQPPDTPFLITPPLKTN